MPETHQAPQAVFDPSGQKGSLYLPIAEHGIIGDLHSIALVGTDGTIDWYCCPRFDSPSVFGSILDAERGGFYRIAPSTSDWTPKQLYLPDTNVLITRFLTPGGVGEVQDFMPIQAVGSPVHRHRLIRRVLGVRGEMRNRPPRSASRIAAKMLGESKRGQQYQSIVPSVPTSATVWRSPIRPCSAIGR